ncbi:MAG: NAD(P)/FAD-dependent oxidoreductase [SAR324 cluster bacterium]|nr:NAD(P)/FAD-dependent oxidoreductase [SAR324 cluster bacterium]
MGKKRIIVIGGGAAGLMAAGKAAESGAETLLLEKMPRLGRKLAITGKGRCNLTNIADISEFMTHFGKNGRFLRQAFQTFFNTDLMAFMQERGLRLVTERGSRVFPVDGRAQAVVTLLTDWARRCGVEIRNSTSVEKLLVADKRVRGVKTSNGEIHSDAVILATGGASYPATGSTGDGYRLARSVGHTIVPIRPALVPLETEGNIAGRMSGLNLRNIKVRLLIKGKKKAEAFGELVFADFGVTGPVILQLSGLAVDGLMAGDIVGLAVDLKPALDETKLDARLLRDFADRNREPISSILRGLLPAQMIPVCLELTQIPLDRSGATISAKERRRLKTWLKGFQLEITGHRPFSEAIITAGGVDTREIDPQTMASRLVAGLFLAGELLDIQAHTGGYNLQAAFSTGWLAGMSSV